MQPTQTKKGRISGTLKRVFFIVFAVVFAILFVQVVFANPHFEYNIPLTLLFAVLWGALFFGLYMLLVRSRFGCLLEKREKLFLLLFFVFQIFTQLFFFSQTAGYASFDVEKVHYGALNFTVNGFIEDPYLDYFYKYPHNMPLVILLQFVYRLFYRFGLPMENFLYLGMAVNAVCMLLAFLFTYLCARHLFGVRYGFLAFAVLYLCIPLQSYVSVFYTDTLTLLFAPFAFYCYLRMRDAKTRKGRILAAIAMGAGLAFGAKLKYSVVIVLIAILATLLLNGKWKQLLASLGVFLVCFSLLTMGFNRYMYAHFLDESLAADKATPFASWIMMSLTGDGSHNAYDNDRVWYYETAEEKQQEAIQVIKERLASRNLWQHIQFYNQKSLRSFGSGNLDAVRWVVDAPIRDTTLARLMTPGYPGNKELDTFFQGYHVMLFSLIIAGAIIAARKKDCSMFMPYLAIFGLYLFLLLWEASQRYLLSFYGLFVLAAVFALFHLGKNILPKKQVESAASVQRKKTVRQEPV